MWVGQRLSGRPDKIIFWLNQIANFLRLSSVISCLYHRLFFFLKNQRPTKAVGGGRRGIPELILEVETETRTLLWVQPGEIKGKHDCSVWKGLSLVGTILSAQVLCQ